MTEYGYKELQLTDEQLAEFYSNQTKFIENLYENEYLILKDASGAEIENYIFQRGFLKKINYNYIENKYCGIIKPRNLYQKLAIHMLQDTESRVKIIRGVYGSGKDLLMFNEALAQLEHGNYQKIIYVRPNVTVANVPDIGFLKGDLEEKLGWTLGPLIDKIGGEDELRRLIASEKLEMAPLLFIRGRSFDNSIVYVTEGQNMTTEIVKLLISRVGEGSSLWINSDNHQTDKQVFTNDNGILKMIEKLKGNPLVSHIYLPITERSSVARLADLLDE